MLLRPVQRTELVAVRVAHIGQVHGTLLRTPPHSINSLPAARDRGPGEALGHAGLPTRAGRTPTLHHLGRQTERNKLTLIGLARPPALADDGTAQHLLGQLREFLVLGTSNTVRVDTLQVRAQSTPRGGFAHVYWPFSC